MSIGPPHCVCLPPELIAHIVRSVVPSTQPGPIAYPPSHIVTKTLLALAQVSSLTYCEAVRLLYQHCLWIDAPEQLHGFSKSLMIMAGLQSTRHTDSRLPSLGNLRWRRDVFEPASEKKGPLRSQTLPNITPHQYITSLFLRPFALRPAYWGTDVDIEGLHLSHDLLSLVAPTLRRLVLDLDFEYTHTKKLPTRVRAHINEALSQLTSLEVFFSMQNDYHEQSRFDSDALPLFWHSLTNLQTMIVCDADHRDYRRFWSQLKMMPCFRTLVVARPRDPGSFADVVRGWVLPQEVRQLNVIMIDERSNDLETSFGSHGSVAGGVSIKHVSFPRSASRTGRRVLKQWVKGKALSGEEPIEWSLPDDWVDGV